MTVSGKSDESQGSDKDDSGFAVPRPIAVAVSQLSVHKIIEYETIDT